MQKCGSCGSQRMKRVRRLLWERFTYLAIYQCRNCKAVESVPRSFLYHFGTDCRCPKCGTFRVTKLRERDHIDPMMPGIWNLLERLAGGKLYHCRYCRVQFYDRRRLKPRETAEMQSSQQVIVPPDTASSGA
jgi:hypothetical protein